MENDQSNQNQGSRSGQPQGGQGPGGRDIIIDDGVLGEYANEPAFDAFRGKSLRDVCRSLENAQKFLADKTVVPKGVNDRPEVWEALYSKLGRPETPDGYQFAKPKLPAGLQYDTGLERAFARECHRLGILPKQAQKLFEFYNAQVTEALNTELGRQERAYGEGHDALARMFPGEDPSRVAKIANDVLLRVAADRDEVNYIVQNYGNNPSIIGLLYRIGQSNAETPLVKGEKAPRFDDAGSAAAEKKAILHDKSHPLHEAYFDKRHPQHRHAVQKVTDLNTLLVGNRPVATNQEVEW